MVVIFPHIELSVFFLESKQYQDLAHFTVWLHWKMACHFKSYQDSQAYIQFPFKEKKMKFPLMMFQWAVMLVACMKKNGMLALLKLRLKKMMFWWSFCTQMFHQHIFIGLQLCINALDASKTHTTIALYSICYHFKVPLYLPRNRNWRIHWNNSPKTFEHQNMVLCT